MNYNILHSLQHMAAAKIAIAIFYDNEIENNLLEERKYPRGFLDVDFNSNRHQLWKLIQIRTFEKTSCLPAILQTKVCNYIHGLHEEVEDWISDHTHLLDLNGLQCRLFFKNSVCWKSNGTINKVETAKKIVQNINIDPNIRFIVACTYFLEDDILALWYGDKNICKSNLRHKGTNSAVRFWLKWLRKGSGVPWRLMAGDYFSFPCVLRLDIPLGLTGFFPYLSLESKRRYSEQLNKDEFFLYLCKLADADRASFLKHNFQTALYFCLKWPFQSLFIEMVKELESLGGVIDFEFIFLKIVSCIIRGLQDIDYVELLKELWNCSSSFKENVETSMTFSMVMDVILNYDADNQTLSLEEILDNCIHFKYKY